MRNYGQLDGIQHFQFLHTNVWEADNTDIEFLKTLKATGKHQLCLDNKGPNHEQLMEAK